MLPFYVALIGLQSSLGLQANARPLAPTLVQAGEVASVHFVLTNEKGKEVANTIRRGLPMTVQAGDSTDALLGTRIVGLRAGSEISFQLTVQEIREMKLARLVGSGSATLKVVVVAVGSAAASQPN